MKQTNLTVNESEESKKAENKDGTYSERFLEKVITEFGKSSSGELQISDYQKRLAQWYFIGIDRALKTAEEYRIAKNKRNKDTKYNNNLPITWNNVNLNDLAIDVVKYARMGLDMMQKNHINAVPYKNATTNRYDIGFLPGYSGIEYIAMKYALDAPLKVITELVYTTDTFQPIKQDFNNPIESYVFKINNPFERGNIIGGFGYIIFSDPTKNKLIQMSIKDIMKRKPDYAAAEFWGGKKTVYEDGKKEEKEVEGWFAEMCLKTLKREVYSSKHITLDPKKIDDNYIAYKEQERITAERLAEAEIAENANAIDIDLDDTLQISEPFSEAEVVEAKEVDAETGEITKAQKEKPASPTISDAEQMSF